MQATKAVKGTLNKLTPEKFERLLQQLVDVVTSAEILHTTISLVFESAVAQPTFVAMYADLCDRLSKVCLLNCMCAIASTRLSAHAGSETGSTYTLQVSCCIRESCRPSTADSIYRPIPVVNYCADQPGLYCICLDLSFCAFHWMHRSMI